MSGEEREVVAEVEEEKKKKNKAAAKGFEPQIASRCVSLEPEEAASLGVG